MRIKFTLGRFESAIFALALTVAASHAQIFTTVKSFGFIGDVTGYNPQSTVVQGADGTLYGTSGHADGIVAGTLFKVQPDGSGFTVLKWFTNSLEGAYPYPALTLAGSVLYGTTAGGGSSNLGTVYRINADGTGYSVLKSFTGNDGASPYYASLILSGGALYGTTYYGGSSNSGTLFRLNTDGTAYTVLKNFAPGSGANPNTAVNLSGSVLYGTTENGGSAGFGTLFKIGTNGTGFSVLKNFTNSPDGAYPDGYLTLSDGVLYGTTYRGGTSYEGTVFKIDTNGAGYTLLADFDPNSTGGNPDAGLVLSGGVLYGTTMYSGSSGGYGTVYRLNTDGTGFTALRNFAYVDGDAPIGLTLSGSVLYGATIYGGDSGIGALYKMNADGTGFSVLKSFGQSTTDAAYPAARLALSGGVLYGTTGSGGSSNLGTVFRIAMDGKGYNVIKSFNGNDGASPYGFQLSGGTIYGATSAGGNSNAGTVFTLNTDGTGYTVLKDFGGGDGASPYGLMLSGGVIYGATAVGGISNVGTVFRVNLDGTDYRVLHDFTDSPDGSRPYGDLVLSGDVLYGTTYSGGSSIFGTVFKIATDGTGYAVLKSFVGGSDGANPEGRLALSGGALFGTTFDGGGQDSGTIFRINTDGTGYTVLRQFASQEGSSPLDLTLWGNALYGVTVVGGRSGNGTLFKINTDGTGFTVLKHFAGAPDGNYPIGDLTFSGNALYGTTSAGGNLGFGTVFSLALPVPQLTITPSGVPPSGVILSWPTNVAGFDYTGYTLQSTTNLLSPATWVTNSSTPVIINGQSTVTNPIIGTQKFYRLTR